MGQQPTGAVDICNLALDRIGQAPIANILTPGTVYEDILSRHYDQTRRKMLRKFIFNFARQGAILSPSLSAPAFPDFVNAFQLPPDFIRLCTLGDRILFGGNIPARYFELSNGYIYTNHFDDSDTFPVPAAGNLVLTGLFRSGDLYGGVAVPAGSTVVVVTGTPVAGAQYLVSGVLGAVQANGNTYTLAAGVLGNLSVYYLQTTAGQNFSSAAWGAYTSGGALGVTFVPPTSGTLPGGLRMTYIYDAQVVPLFDPLFIDVLVLELAKKISFKFTLKPALVKSLEDELLDANLAAAAVAGQERPPIRVQRSRIRDVRRSGGIFRNTTIIGGG